MPRNRVPFLIAKILSGQRVCFRLSLRLLTPIVVVGAWLALPVGSVPAQADTVSQIWELNYISASYQSMSAAACPSPADCYVGTQSSSVAAILGTKSGGLTWVSQSVPTTSATVNGIACTGDSSCIAAVGQTSNGVASGGLWSTTNGTSWSSQNIPTSVALNDVACPSTSTCFAVGTSSSATGVALGTTDGGSTWTILTVPPGVGALDGVACTSMQDCIAVGADSIVGTTNGGATWTTQALPIGIVGTPTFNSVACDSSATCYAVGSTNSGAVAAKTSGGGVWTNLTLPAGLETLRGIACPTAKGCTSVGGNPSSSSWIIATDDGGATSTVENPPGELRTSSWTR